MSTVLTNPDGFLIFATRQHESHLSGTKRTTFYREELVRHWWCLERQREYYSEKAIGDVKSALVRLDAEIDTLCERENGEQIVGGLLSSIDGVTRLSAWSDPKKHH